MQIEHVGLWVSDLERMKQFYETHFNAKAGEKYTNEKKQFKSYFLNFDSGARLEIMHKPKREAVREDRLGYHHLAIKLESKQDLNDRVEALTTAGYQLLSGPRTTGDGYYEAVIEDPEGNWIELTI